uniref:Uncharacterized protein n=1 Tax=Triticum urartu TaxID=4572 RepID=A0A8R7K3F0_TRIUA
MEGHEAGLRIHRSQVLPQDLRDRAGGEADVPVPARRRRGRAPREPPEAQGARRDRLRHGLRVGHAAAQDRRRQGEGGHAPASRRHPRQGRRRRRALRGGEDGAAGHHRGRRPRDVDAGDEGGLGGGLRPARRRHQGGDEVRCGSLMPRMDSAFMSSLVVMCHVCTVP